MRVVSVGWLLCEDASAFVSVLGLNESISHPVVMQFLSIAKGSVTNPAGTAVPEGG